MKIDNTMVIEEVLLKIRKTGRKTVSRKTLINKLGEALQYIVKEIERELIAEGIKITK